MKPAHIIKCLLLVLTRETAVDVMARLTLQLVFCVMLITMLEYTGKIIPCHLYINLAFVSILFT